MTTKVLDFASIYHSYIIDYQKYMTKQMQYVVGAFLDSIPIYATPPYGALRLGYSHSSRQCRRRRAEEDTYFYVIITNTFTNSAGIRQTATTVSKRAQITVN